MKKILFLSALVFFAAGAFSQSPVSGNRIITVEGKSSVKVMPEDLSFSVSLSEKDMDYATCAEMAVKKMEQIKQLFVDNGIDEELIKASNYSIRKVQKYDSKTRQQVFDGYEASIPLSIRTRRDYKKNDLIFDLIKDHLQANFNLSFLLSDEQTAAVKEKLITLAVEDARQKAQWITQSTGVKLGKLRSAQYGEPQLIGRLTNNTELMRVDAMPTMRKASTQITSVLSPDEMELQTRIVLAWDIE